MTSTPEGAPTAVVVGVFDGVHLGHQALIHAARTRCGSGGRVVAVTFSPHPAAVLAPHKTPALLLPLAQRVEQLHAAGADEVDIVEFSQATSQWSPEKFVDDVLMQWNPTFVCVGENFRFGIRASGDIATLVRLGAARGFEVAAEPLSQRGSQAVSSTRIRALLIEGEVERAGELLGRPHQLHGVVVHGDARGRELGYPTANLSDQSGFCIPADGVYAGQLTVADDACEHNGTVLTAAISVGTNPQFHGTARRIEAFALDAPADFSIYDCQVHMEFTARLRGQQTFESLDAFLAAMRADVAAVRQLAHR